jgi:hypothetical protein
MPSDPDQISEFKKKPLPSPPTPKIPRNSSAKIQKRRPSSTTDRLKLTCHHGPSPSDVHEVQAALDSIPEGPSMIDRYTEDEQRSERIALGLGDIYDLKSYRRAEDRVTNSPRINMPPKMLHRRKVRHRKQDGPEREERRKTPPSPCDKA